MSKKLKLKSIYELLCNEEGKAESFFIPSYQRGYRWTKQQVEELLEDIWDFAQDVETSKNKGFYCLQPIVVKRNKEYDTKWDVIDGQQRLTTIYIILKVLEDKIESDSKNFDLDYETRPKSKEFLENEIFQENIENIDFFHMSKSYNTIIDWFKNKANKGSPTIKSKFISPLLETVKVIWYEVEEDENQTEKENSKKDIEIFTRINMGKIPLTNAELIKALLIQGYKDNDNKNNKQFELASEWDFIEYSLQNDDFWYFINKEKNEKATRIEFIFELIAQQYIKDKNDLSLNKSIDRYYEFHIINHYLKNDTKDEVQLWNEVKKYFRILNEWYEDREFFHKIGFLIIYSKKTMLDFIAEYTQKSTKKEFIDFLDTEIKKLFENIHIEALSYGSNDNDIRKVLLWFNIATIIKNEKSNLRFQFDRYKKQNWDIEHIRSQADKYPRKKEEKESWIKDILNLTAFEKTKEEILEKNEEEFKKFFNDIQNKIEGEDNNFNKHSIGNLTLLDSATNRAYGNAFFPVKRKTIIENDKNGTFIPICTKNLFLKYYSKNATDLLKWTKQDAEDYKKVILETFKELKNGAENEKQ
ncbi:DUF262 domain-containing protein [Aliarcobacter cryaerophilus]|uniref:DUF262 domain-containing protein n=1 Tax=Aliarcobacter cryaerophilus TaxID=28198 RepID=UPI003DA3BBD0